MRHFRGGRGQWQFLKSLKGGRRKIYSHVFYIFHLSRTNNVGKIFFLSGKGLWGNLGKPLGIGIKKKTNK